MLCLTRRILVFQLRSERVAEVIHKKKIKYYFFFVEIIYNHGGFYTVQNDLGIHMVKMIQTPPYRGALVFFLFMYMVFLFVHELLIL